MRSKKLQTKETRPYLINIILTLLIMTSTITTVIWYDHDERYLTNRNFIVYNIFNDPNPINLSLCEQLYFQLNNNVKINSKDAMIIDKINETHYITNKNKNTL